MPSNRPPDDGTAYRARLRAHARKAQCDRKIPPRMPRATWAAGECSSGNRLRQGRTAPRACCSSRQSLNACLRATWPNARLRRRRQGPAPVAEMSRPNSPGPDKVDEVSRGLSRRPTCDQCSSAGPAGNGPLEQHRREPGHSRHTRPPRRADSAANRRKSPQRRLPSFAATVTQRIGSNAHQPIGTPAGRNDPRQRREKL